MKSCKAKFLSSWSNFPCKSETFPGNLSKYLANNFSTEICFSLFSIIKGATIKTLLLFEIDFSISEKIFLSSSFIIFVVIFLSLNGKSVNVETSKSPYKVKAKVRGIGVALIKSKSAFSPLDVNSILWLTPNLCCSSIIAKPSEPYEISFENKAWVPTTTLISLFIKPLRICDLSFKEVEPNNKATLIP